MAEYRDAPEVRELARDLIEQFHPHLKQVRMEYVWGDVAPEANGKTTYGKAMRISGVNAQLARALDGPAEKREDDERQDCFFCIVLYEDVWHVITPGQRLALLDHELEHCKTKWTKGGRKLFIKPHDMEEFSCIIERHGLWNKGIESMARAIKKTGQLAFLLDEPEEGEARVTRQNGVTTFEFGSVQQAVDTLKSVGK